MKIEEIFAAEADLLRQGLEAWASEGCLAPERSAALASLAHRSMAGSTGSSHPVKLKRRGGWLLGVAAVAVAALALPFAWPGARVWATTTFPTVTRFLGLRVQSEQGWAWAEEHGAFQEVLATAEDRGYTFRVHRVLADPTQTTIIYSVEGPDPREPDFWAGEHDAIRFDDDQFVSHGSGHGRVMDGLFVGDFVVDPLPAERGTMTIALQQIGDLKGRWQVSFPVTREPLTRLASTIPVQQVLDLGGVPLLVREVEVVPTATVVHLRYQGPFPAPSLAVERVELQTESGVLDPHSMSGDGSFDRGGQNGVSDYTLRFPPLPAGTREVTLRIRAVDTVQHGERFVLPLQPGATARGVDLPPVTVLEVRAQSAVVEWTHDHTGVEPYEDWWVIDDQGEAHRAGRHGGTGKTVPGTVPSVQGQASSAPDRASIMTLNVTWDRLPRGRQPVAIEAKHLGRRIEGNWELRIPLN